ncbi:MAG: 1-acyl-sn-glycerol-3-phosphate acyltransferase [Bacteroidales bacterium]|nr:1-acyl-sn-glycerol-3-phosphate acyltransferase [Bacteroidales bacterium]
MNPFYYLYEHSYCIPPALKRWAVKKNGAVREVPVTFKRVAYSLFALVFFLVCTFFVFIPYTLVHRLLPKTEKRQMFYHRCLRYISEFVIRRVPGVRFTYDNSVGETFEKPAVIICNHQSQLDLMAILMMSPKVIILTNDWVWRNIYYGLIIHTAEFYPVSDGMDTNMPRMKDLVKRGYSIVIFPEGTRTNTRNIMRFHKGAFALAKELGVDLLPVCLHGLVDVMPKRDFMLRQGRATLRVYSRMTAEEMQQYDDRQLTKMWHKWYVKEYETMSRELEDIAYCSFFTRYKYMYRGRSVERNCKRMLKLLKAHAEDVEKVLDGVTELNLLDSGHGEVAFTLALRHPEMQIHAYEQDEKRHLLASTTDRIPDNLTFIHGTSPDNDKEDALTHTSADGLTIAENEIRVSGSDPATACASKSLTISVNELLKIEH